MPLPSLTFLSIILFLSEAALALWKHSRAKEGSDKDRKTLRLLWIVIGLSIWGAFALRARRPEWLLPDPLVWYLTGLALFLLGLIVRWTSIIYLGRFFTVDVAIAEDHQLVTRGPYRLVRHPSYTGALLIFLGFGLCTQNLLSLLAIILPISIVFLWRIRVEEAALQGAFGSRYEDYSRETARLIPWLY